MTIKLICKDRKALFGSEAFVHYHRRQWITAYIMYLNDIQESDNIRKLNKAKLLQNLESSIKDGKIKRCDYHTYKIFDNRYINEKRFSHCQACNDDYKCTFFEGLNLFINRDINYCDPDKCQWTPSETRSILKTFNTIRKYLKLQDRDNFFDEDNDKDDVYFLENILYYAVEYNQEIGFEHVDC